MVATLAKEDVRKPHINCRHFGALDEQIDRMSIIIVTTLVILMTSGSQADLIGCYADAGARDLSGPYISEANMTPSKCSAYCFNLGYKFAGTQASTWCFCGDTYGKYGVTDRCTSPCGGDQKAICGGGWANTIMSTDVIGCFADQAVRDLSGASTGPDPTMTISKCRSFCFNLGYKYAGTQNAQWCFCGDTYGKYGSSDTCTVKCGGDANARCGGASANTVISTGVIGCYADTAVRDLSSVMTGPDPAMTSVKCRNYCLNLGYKYAGTQSAQFCFCGDAYGSYGKSDKCTTKCGGDVNANCGGAMANTISPTGVMGCFADQAVRDLTGATFGPDSTMTSSKCRAYCLTKGYKYAGTQNAQWCFCGEVFGKYGTSDTCTVACSGDANAKCGGASANTIMSTDVIGCYADAGDRDLSGPYTSDSTMTPSKCRTYCLNLGYKYAGTQASSWCFCGDTFGKYGITDRCTSTCSGDQKAICGGGWANTIMPTDVVGCFADQAVRDLSGASTGPDPTMTTSKCRSYCLNLGYKYAGTQNGQLCFCGDTFGKYGSSNQCTTKCGGDANAKCGGPLANTIMLTGVVGCFADQAVRDLSGVSVGPDPTMTVFKCRNYCLNMGYQFAGTQASNWCLCGDTFGKYGLSDKCTMKCTGDNNANCGGSWANTIMPTGALGCFADKTERDLSGVWSGPDPTMTSSKCRAYCLDRGYQYAGTQNGQWCCCGDTYGKYGSSNECSVKCSGDGNANCGGAMANTIMLTDMLGCYADTGVRDLSGSNVGPDNTMTSAKCRTYCFSQGFKYAGSQSSFWCFCGDTFGKYGITDRCTSKCGGDQNALCGGGWANTIMPTGNPCGSSPCKNGGVCTNSGTSFTCACTAGWAGTDCATVQNPCLSSPCKNGGTCTATGSSFTCSCVPGWSGNDCTTDVNVCLKGNPCENGGTCVKFGDSYECKCTANWAGTNCAMGSAACHAVLPEHRINCGWGGVTLSQCNERSCCFDPMTGRPACFYAVDNCEELDMSLRADCGFSGISYSQCLGRGCCFDDDETTNPGPVCYRKANPECLGVVAANRISKGSVGIQPNECTAQGWCWDSSAVPNCFTKA